MPACPSPLWAPASFPKRSLQRQPPQRSPPPHPATSVTAFSAPCPDPQSTLTARPPETSWSCRSSSPRTGAPWRSAWTARSSSTTSSATAGATWAPNVPVRPAGPTPSTCPTPVLPTTNPQNGLSKRFRIRSVWHGHSVVLKMLQLIVMVPGGNSLMLHTVWKIRPLLLAL